MRERPLQQKVIGILGGMSDRATVEYYQMINQQVNQSLGGWDIAETIIIGCNFGNIEHFVRQNEWGEARKYLHSKAMAAQNAGADVLICMSNTMHKVLSDVENIINIPFIHIAHPTAQAIKKQGLNKVALLGTLPVMAEDYMRKEYEDAGIEVLVPDDEQQVRIDKIIFDELVKNEIRLESKQYYLDVAESLNSKGAEGIILGCTEIFLLIEQSDLPTLPLFNTTELHVKAIAQYATTQ